MTATCRLSTIFSAEVVGYSHLMAAHDQSTLILGAMDRLAVDRPGYSGLIKAGEEGMLERLKAYCGEIVDPKITKHRGRILKTTSDGMLVEFADPVEAVRCAVEVQQNIAERNAGTAVDKRLTFRIALDFCNVATDEAINICARLQALTDPGSVCISHAVHELIRDKLQYVFEDIGEYGVEKVVAPVRAYVMSAEAVAMVPCVIAQRSLASGQRWVSPRSAVIAASVAVTIGIWTAAWWSWFVGNSSTTPIQALVAANPPAPQLIDNAGDRTTQAPPVSEQPQLPSSASNQVQLPSPGSAHTPPRSTSIVVLPFANLANDPSQQYFADAMTDEFTSALSRISEIFVIARNTAFAYESKSRDSQEVGRELGVRYVLDGGVGRSGDQVWIDAQLIDVESTMQLWKEHFGTDFARLDEAEDNIILRLARIFGLDFVEPASAGLDRKTPVDPAARDLIMRGWAWYYRPYSTATWQEARRDFEQALEVDPASVDARIGLATILGGKLAEGWTPSLQQDAARAEELLGEALERDPKRSAAHFAMGVLRQMQNRLPEAQAEYEAAIALDHNRARAYLHLGQVLMFLGQPEAGAPPIEKAIRLNPYDPNIASAYWALGTCYLLRGQLDEAIAALKKAQAANARLWFPHLYLAGAFGLEGDLNEARLALAEATKLNPAVKSLARMRSQNPWLAHARHWDLQEQTLNVGLRRAGLPEE
jgi:adenylate cyclase